MLFVVPLISRIFVCVKAMTLTWVMVYYCVIHEGHSVFLSLRFQSKKYSTDLREMYSFHHTSFLDGVHKVGDDFTGRKICFLVCFEYTPNILNCSRSGLSLTLELSALKSFL